MPLSFAESSDGIVMMANGIDPVLRWNGYDPAATRAGVEAPTAAPAVAASGVGSITGTYYAFVRFVDKFGNRSNPSPISAAVAASANSTINYTSIPVPTEGTVVRRQILRNTAGQATTFYVDIDTVDLVSTALNSTRVDGVLSTQEAQPMLDAGSVSLYDRFGRPPDHLAIMAFHLQRMWGGGIADYAEGSIALTNGSAAVTGSGVVWKDTFVGRYLHVLGGDKAYSIATVDPVAGTLTLTEVYAGTTDPFAAYSVRPDPTVTNNVYFSEAQQPEAWPADNALTIKEDGDQITAMMSVRSFLCVAKRRSMFRISAQSNPREDGFVFESVGRGCVNNRCWVKVDEAVYVLDEQGAYKFDGQHAQPISTAIQDMFRSAGKNGFRINWKCARYFHCLYSPAEEVVRWFVTLNGGYMPRFALCYATNLERWWIEEFPVPVGCSVLGRTGRPTSAWVHSPDTPYLGGPGGLVYALDAVTDAAGQWQPESAGDVLSAGSVTIEPRRTVGPWAVGAPLSITAGRGMGQTRLVVAVRSDGDVEVNRPWLVIPDKTSRFAVGAIGYEFKTHRLMFAASEDQEGFSLTVGFQPAPWGALSLRLWIDHGVKPDLLHVPVSPKDDGGVRGEKGDLGYTIDLTNPRGYAIVRADRHGERDTPHGRSVAMQVVGFSGPAAHTINTVLANGVVG